MALRKEKARNRTFRNIEEAYRQNGYSRLEFCRLMDWSTGTYTRRGAVPETLTLGELERAAAVAGKKVTELIDAG